MKRVFNIQILALSMAVLLAACGGGGGGGNTPPSSGGSAPDMIVTDSAAPNNDLQISFGNVTQNFTLDETVTITNNGTADLVIGTIGNGHSLAAPFSKTTDACSNQTIVPGGSCALTIRFAPTTAVTSNDSFDIPSNDPNKNAVTVSVNGTGTVLSVPDITVTDSVAPNDDLWILFGSVTVNTTATGTVMISNSGGANLTIGTILPPASPFGIVNASACSGQTLAPAASCVMTVQMTPSAAGDFSSSIVIPSNDPDENPVTVSVSGKGVAAPVPNITVSPTSLPFGSGYCPGDTNALTVNISNTGTAGLSITSISNSGDLAFSQTNACPASLAPNASCAVTVDFTAGSSGTKTGTLAITSNDPDTPTTNVSLSATVASAASCAPPPPEPPCRGICP